MSYLSDSLEDFEYNNKVLYDAMPMGYTTLTVIERAYFFDQLFVISILVNICLITYLNYKNDRNEKVIIVDKLSERFSNFCFLQKRDLGILTMMLDGNSPAFETINYT